MAVWVVVLPLLAVFSMSLVGTALASQATVQGKAGALVPPHPDQGKLVLLETGGSFSLFKEYFGLKPSSSVCWVSARTLASLQARYATSVSTVDLGARGSFRLVTVQDADTGHVRQVIGQNPCALVQSHRTFFLPLDGHTS
ncbi:MAG TPA: hypothetical protein VM049_07850 [Gaiellaceae bacterium]|nr:hypothetical protein [Gaiellaceae bacterium]